MDALGGDIVHRTLLPTLYDVLFLLDLHLGGTHTEFQSVQSLVGVALLGVDGADYSCLGVAFEAALKDSSQL